MSTTVLARKYRPRDFASMVGQPHVVQALGNALAAQRLHHAYLFTGTRGVGKTTVARVLAKSLNCTGPDGKGGITAEPCGVCESCRDIDAGRFIDYVELDAASNRGVDEISQLLDQAVYKPVLGRFKVYLIDEVHMLSTHAFNAMLKTLEEPPDYLKFVLATTDPQKVPATVLSRCLQFNLRPMAPATIVDHLRHVLAAECIEAEAAALALVARAAHGSMRDALSLLDQAIAFGGGRVDAVQVRQMLGAVDRSHAARIVEALAAGDGAALLAAVDGLRELGLSAAGALEEMAILLQQMAVLQSVPDAVDSSDPDGDDARRLASSLAGDETQLLYSISVAGRAELSLAPDEYSGLVMVLLRMLVFVPKAAGRSVAPAAAPTPAPEAITAAEPSPATAKIDIVPAGRRSSGREAAERWIELARRLVGEGLVTAMVRELAVQSECLAVVEAGVDPGAGRPQQTWQLSVERENLRTTALREKLQGAVARCLDCEVALQLEAGAAKDTVAARDAAERARRQSEAERVIQDDPLVKALLAQYDTARIVPGSVKPH